MKYLGNEKVIMLIWIEAHSYSARAHAQLYKHYEIKAYTCIHILVYQNENLGEVSLRYKIIYSLKET